MKVLGIIPARGGSKGIKNKNIVPVAGKPLIEWTINEALKSKHIDNLIVSTNSNAIAEISQKAGATVPFKRPEKLSLDHIGNEPVVNHVLKEYAHKFGTFPENVIYLAPTNPLRTVADIDGAIEFFLENKDCMDSLISVKKCGEHPYWTKAIDDDGFMEDFIPLRPSVKKKNYRRQNLPDVYSLNGAIFISKAKEIYNSESFYSGAVGMYVMSKENSLDINDSFDLKLAELLLKDRECK